jgi:hypothetical protein
VTQNGCCLYCKCTFLRSPYRPQQTVCSRPECQRRRRADYHRRKLEADPEYRQIAHDSQKKWREAHPDYLPHYRAAHGDFGGQESVCACGPHIYYDGRKVGPDQAARS